MINQCLAKIGTSFFASRKQFHRLSYVVESKKTTNRLRFGKIEKIITVIIIIGILLVSAFGFAMQTSKTAPTVQPVNNDPSTAPSTTNSPTSTNAPTVWDILPTENPMIIPLFPGTPAPDYRGFFEKTPVMNSTAWHQVATYAWNYFQPGKGVDSTTWLPAGSWGWNYFTDWDLGVYIQAVIDAQKLGLVNTGEYGGSSMRLEKVVKFLETRPLNGTNPYWFYSSTGEGYKIQSQFDVVDSGTLFVALNNLKTYNSSLTQRIDAFVYNSVNGVSNRTDYASAVPQIKAECQTSTSIYAYYIVAGYLPFFPELNGLPDKVLENILSAPTVTRNNATMHNSTITCEPLLYSFFYLNYNPKLALIVNQTYAFHEAFSQATGEFVAFSEGNRGDEFVYEWVVLPNGDTWKITKPGSSAYVDMKPIIFTRVAVSFLSIYNSTYAKDMCIYLEKAMLPPDDGYFEGAEYNIDPQRGNYISHIGCNTNGLILAAARYAVR
jgi:hypothetical protein